MTEAVDLKRRSFLLGRLAPASQAAGPPIAVIGPSCLAFRGIACMSCRDVCPVEAVRFELAVGGARPSDPDRRLHRLRRLCPILPCRCHTGFRAGGHGMTGECHISSLVVHSRPDRVPFIVECIGAIAGAEVHGGEDIGKLIVTLETETESQVVERINAIQLLDGVLAATLVFHHFEPVQERE